MAEPRVKIEPEYHELIYPIESNIDNPLDPLPEKKVGPYRYLSKTEAVPKVERQETSMVNPEAEVVELDPKTPLATGDSIWWRFTVAMHDTTLPKTTEEGEWKWHSPTLLEFNPSSSSDSITTPAMQISSTTGQKVHIEKRTWNFRAPLLEKSVLVPEKQKLVLCFLAPISIENLRESLMVSSTNGRTEKPIFLPFEQEDQKVCGERNAIGLHWDVSKNALVHLPDRQQWFSGPTTGDGHKVSCRDEPCLSNSPIDVYVDGNKSTTPILRAPAGWGKQRIKPTHYGWEINGDKPIGKNKLKILIGEQSIKDEILVQNPTPKIVLNTRIIVPKNQTIHVTATGLWMVSLHPVRQQDWANFVRKPSELVLTTAVNTEKFNAVGQIEFKLPDTGLNYVVRFTSGEQSHLAWLVPENLNLTILHGKLESVIVVKNEDGPVENAIFHYENGRQHSNKNGEIHVQGKKLSPDAWIEWRNMWTPIPENKPESNEKKPSSWPIYLSNNSIKPTDSLKVVGWAPAANSEVNWSISSNERLDILSGSKMSGPDSEVEFSIPIPKHFPESEYQLGVTQKDQRTIKYFKVEKDETRLEIEHFWKNDELVLKLRSEPLLDLPSHWSIEVETNEGWSHFGTYWVPSTSHLRIENPEKDWTAIRVRIGKSYDVIKDIAPAVQKYARQLREQSSSVRQFSPVSVSFDLSKGECDDEEWFVSNKDDVLCTAQTDEACTFQAKETGLFKLKIHCIKDGKQKGLGKLETTVFGANGTEARITRSRDEVFIQARSSSADLRVYTLENGHWKGKTHAITNGHLVLTEQPDLNTHLFLWDDFGGTQQYFETRQKNDLTLSQDGSAIILKGLDSAGGAFLLKANPAPTALSGLHFSEDKNVLWLSNERLNTPTPIKAIGKNMTSDVVWFHPNPEAIPNLHAPKQLRLGEKTQVEIKVFNPTNQEIRFSYRLTGPKGLGLNHPLLGQIELKPMTRHTIPLFIEAKGYGKHSLMLDTDLGGQAGQSTAKIEVKVGLTDQITETEYHVDLGNQSRYTRHDLPVSNRPVEFSTNIQPTLEAVKAARLYSELPPSANGKAQKIWIANALWGDLSHAGAPERLTLLDQATESILSPFTAMTTTDQILWDAGLVLSLKNGVTPAMRSLMDSFEKLPRDIPKNMSDPVQQTLQSMQFWTVAMANTGIYRGLAPKPDNDWQSLNQSDKWKDYPVIAQSMLLCAAVELKDVTFRNDILQYWTENIDLLTAPLPLEIKKHFGWQDTAGTSSAVWALAKVAPNSLLFEKVKSSDKVALVGFWSILAHSVQKNIPKTNLRPALLEEQILLKEGRYHPYETLPVHYQTIITEPTTWQVLMYGRGRQYYTLTSFRESQQKERFEAALVNIDIGSLNTDEKCFRDCILKQHETYQIEMTIDGLERNKKYVVHVPQTNGFNTQKPKIIGGEPLQVNNEWLTFEALGPTVEIKQITEARHVGKYRVLPIRIYETTNSKFLASSASTVWTIR